MSYVLLALCIIIFSAYFGLKYYVKRTVWCRSQTCLVGKTTIVTGANSGIGYETALDFAKRGARVILACRNEEKAQEARSRIIKETGNANIVAKIVDFASFESVRNFAKDINKNEARLDILVNNAGAAGIGDRKSKDGNVLLMQVNYFSPFLLTNLLIGLLKKSAPSRVVNVSSLAAKFAKFELDDLNTYKGPKSDYARTKICNIWFTMELAKKLEGSGITAYSLHPGGVQTEIFRRAKDSMVLKFAYNHFFKTSEEGAQTTIYLSVTKGIEDYNGEYFVNCRRVEPYPSVSDQSSITHKLWEKTEEIVQLKPEEVQF